jgi:hypothetical protein
MTTNGSDQQEDAATSAAKTHSFVELIVGKQRKRLRIDESPISSRTCRALAGGHEMGAHALHFRSKIMGRAATLRCDHCRGQLGVSVRRYWRMRFCCTACTSEYQQRLSRETQLKILTLVNGAIETGAVQLVMFSSFGSANEEPRSTQRRQALDLKSKRGPRAVRSSGTLSQQSLF